MPTPKDANNAATLLMLKGLVSEMPEEQRNTVNTAKAEIEAVVEKHGELGGLALIMVALEGDTE